MNKEQETGLKKGDCHYLNLRLLTRGNVSCDLVWWMELYLLRETTDYKTFFPCGCRHYSAPAYSRQQQGFIPQL